MEHRKCAGRMSQTTQSLVICIWINTIAFDSQREHFDISWYCRCNVRAFWTKYILIIIKLLYSWRLITIFNIDTTQCGEYSFIHSLLAPSRYRIAEILLFSTRFFFFFRSFSRKSKNDRSHMRIKISSQQNSPYRLIIGTRVMDRSTRRQ